MLGEAKKYFTLIAQSVNRAEVEQAGAAYTKTHPSDKVIIDHWNSYYDQSTDIGFWRARAWITIKRSPWQRFLYTLGR